MKRKISKISLAAALGLALMALGCESGGVGDPCTPEDEYTQTFSGFSAGEVNVESRSFQCETRICLVNHFQGRVSCPYGQRTADLTLAGDDPARCRIPGTDGTNPDDQITVEVSPQFAERQADKAVYCSCRCKGPDEGARYCECPSGYSCTDLVKPLGLPGGQLAGSYCVRNGTKYNVATAQVAPCDPLVANCGENGNP